MCSYCSIIKKNLGGNKRYNCNNCNNTLDRDINGCRNILMKGLKNKAK